MSPYGSLRGSTRVYDSEHKAGSKGTTGVFKYARELRGDAAVLGGDGTAPTGAAAFATTYAAAFAGAATGGPRSHTPPRRQLGAVYGGLNDPFRDTSIY